MVDNDTYLVPDVQELRDRNPNREPNGWLKPGNATSRGNSGGNPEAKAQYAARMLWRGAATEEEQLKVRGQLVERCMAGNMAAIRLYVDIMHGKQAIPIELSGPDGESIRTEQASTLAVVLGALQAFPEAKIKVAAALSGRSAVQMEVSRGPDDGIDAAV
jgi:hypothetical protein